MADDRLAVAIDLVARAALADLVDGTMDDLWGDNYPEVGEHDWERVTDRLNDLLRPLLDGRSADAQAAALEYLAARADDPDGE